MLKKVLTIAAASALSTPAFAGFYVNVENNGSYTGKDYTGSGTDLHLGYENGNAFGSYSYKVVRTSTILIMAIQKQTSLAKLVVL